MFDRSERGLEFPPRHTNRVIPHEIGLVGSVARWRKLMRTFNRFLRQRRPTWTTVEALEERAMLTSLTGTAATEQVQVLEWDAAAPDDAETTEAIAVSELPPVVIAAVNARLPRATILAAETDMADGLRQFGVRTEFRGAELVVTLTPDGEVLEIEQAVAVADLPSVLSDWLATQFPGAEILQAERVTADGSVSYELMIASIEQTTLEATVRLAGANSSLNVPLSDNDQQGELASSVVFESVMAEPTESVRETFVIPSDRTESADSNVPVATVNRANDASGADRDPIRTNLPTSQSPLRAQNLTSDESLSASRLPLMEHVLNEVLPVDFSTLERALQDFLAGVDSLTDPLAEGGPVRRWLPFVVAAAAMLGIERVISDRRKRDQDVALATVGRSSWTWVLKLSTVSRSREA